MDKVALHFDDLDNDGNWLPELTDYDLAAGNITHQNPTKISNLAIDLQNGR